MSKRTLDGFFHISSPSRKRARRELETPTPKGPSVSGGQSSNHATYPYPIPHFPLHIAEALSNVPATEGKEINDQPDLDLVYFQPYIPKSIERDLFEFLRQELFFYRVQYKIRRGSVETQINTPRL